MGQRTRNHIIEDKSRLAFSEILPENWVYRDKDKDYGIDCEVEIFDHDGNSTGYVFWVQLKGTESQITHNIRNLSFTPEKIYQFQNYIIPVLIVRYSLFEKKLYFNWANDITSQKRTEKQIKVQFSNAKILEKFNVKDIFYYLQRFHKCSAGNIGLPLNTFITKNIYSENPVLASSTQFFKKIIYSESKFFTIVRNENESLFQLKVGEGKVYLTLSDSKFASIGFSQEDLDVEKLNYYGKVVLVSTALILYQSSKKELADDIFFSNSLLDIIKNKREYLIYFLPHLLTGENFELVLNELDDIFDVYQDNFIQNITLMILMMAKKSDPKRQDVFENFLLKQIQYAKATDYTFGIALSTYNLGNFYRSIGKFGDALSNYIQARRLNPEYKKQAYFHFEIAGILFEQKRYYFASKFYTKSLTMDKELVMAKALLGDSLMYLGCYEDGLKYFDEFLIEQKDNENVNKEEWYLKYLCINTLILHGYAKNQKRNIKQSAELVNEKDIDGAIEHDMLSAIAWMENGFKASNDDEKLEAYISFLFSALLDKYNIHTWVYATISGFIAEAEKETYLHVNDLVTLAYFYHQELYVDLLEKYVLRNMPEVYDSLMNLLDLTIKNIENREIAVRIFEDAENYHKIVL